MRRQNSRHWLCTLHTGVCYIVKSGIYKYTSTTTILLRLPFFVNTFCYVTQQEWVKIVYTYRVVCQKLSAPELGPYITYGILAARDLRGCQQVVQFISDVSLDRALVEALARRCTAAQLDPCHLLDVVEDAIGG